MSSEAFSASHRMGKCSRRERSTPQKCARTTLRKESVCVLRRTVPDRFFLLFFTFRGFTTSSWSKSSELITLNLCEAGWPPLPSSGAAWSPEPLSVELSELLLLLGSLATELATEEPLSLVSETGAPDGFSPRCPGACSAQPGVSRPSRTEKESWGSLLAV